MDTAEGRSSLETHRPKPPPATAWRCRLSSLLQALPTQRTLCDALPHLDAQDLICTSQEATGWPHAPATTPQDHLLWACCLSSLCLDSSTLPLSPGGHSGPTEHCFLGQAKGMLCSALPPVPPVERGTLGSPAWGLELGATGTLGTVACHRPHPPMENGDHHLQLWGEGEEEGLARAVEALAEPNGRGGEGAEHLEGRGVVEAGRSWGPLATPSCSLGEAGLSSRPPGEPPWPHTCTLSLPCPGEHLGPLVSAPSCRFSKKLTPHQHFRNASHRQAGAKQGHPRSPLVLPKVSSLDILASSSGLSLMPACTLLHRTRFCIMGLFCALLPLTF